jgi:hypothetical protein
MRVQWEILLFLFCLNLSIGLVVALGLPSTEYVNPIVGDATNATLYEENFNQTAIEGWGSTPFSGIPIIGDIFAGFQFFISNVGYLFDGFPQLLTWLADTYITDAGGMLAFAIIANALRAIYALLICTFLIEFISGRYISE